MPRTHALARWHEISLSELLVFSVVGCHPDHLPGLRWQMQAIQRRYAAARGMVTCEASALVGYATRVAAGLGVRLADVGHLRMLRCRDLVVVPLLADVRLTIYSLRPVSRFGHLTSLHRACRIFRGRRQDMSGDLSSANVSASGPIHEFDALRRP